MIACSAECGFDDAACSDLQTYDVAFCRVQFPLEIVESPGAEVTVYGRLYAGGLTDLKHHIQRRAGGAAVQRPLERADRTRDG